MAPNKTPPKPWGTIFREVCASRGFARPHLADLAGVSIAEIAAWESDTSLPTDKALSRIYGGIPKLKHFRHELYLARLEHQKRRQTTVSGKVSLIAVPPDPGPPSEPPMPEPPPPAPGAADTFGFRLAQARVAAGFKQHELALYLSSPQSHLSLWELDRENPPDDILAKLRIYFPELADAPPPCAPDRIRRKVRAYSRALKIRAPEATAPAPPIQPAPPTEPQPEPEETAMAQPTPIKAAPVAPASPPETDLARWIRAKRSMRTSPRCPEVVAFLCLARGAGLTFDELIDELGGPSAG